MACPEGGWERIEGRIRTVPVVRKVICTALVGGAAEAEAIVLYWYLKSSEGSKSVESEGLGREKGRDVVKRDSLHCCTQCRLPNAE
jgi:hypothetical protein